MNLRHLESDRDLDPPKIKNIVPNIPTITCEVRSGSKSFKILDLKAGTLHGSYTDPIGHGTFKIPENQAEEIRYETNLTIISDSIMHRFSASPCKIANIRNSRCGVSTVYFVTSINNIGYYEK